ncbi:hypothetical protein GCM10010977_15560 [Citricoccus zhacaiensis]|uniref:Uncharacterized protein n=1 Tax=Citricoccus zhacaiensis TaxID=489142 RepID=A0ABQ2LY61_9MICC|nr:hypothetical protein GCM10010977_15560 [Citricoccus zhacaiensis]
MLDAGGRTAEVHGTIRQLTVWSDQDQMTAENGRTTADQPQHASFRLFPDLFQPSLAGPFLATPVHILPSQGKPAEGGKDFVRGTHASTVPPSADTVASIRQWLWNRAESRWNHRGSSPRHITAASATAGHSATRRT